MISLMVILRITFVSRMVVLLKILIDLFLDRLKVHDLLGKMYFGEFSILFNFFDIYRLRILSAKKKFEDTHI